MSFKSDIEIAREANKLPISEIAKKLNISFQDIVPYGHDKAKISESFIKEIPQNKTHVHIMQFKHALLKTHAPIIRKE